MTLPFVIGGFRTVIPGIYDSFRVQGSLPSAVPAGRSILIIGESEKGIPSAQLDLRLNFFTDSQTVRDTYGRGSISDAAKQIFTTQPGDVFAGSVRRLYVWKSNQTTRAQRAIASPSNYGAIGAAEFGEEGNGIRTRIRNVSEILPSKTFAYAPTTGAISAVVSLNGEATTLTIGALNIGTGVGSPVQVATQLATVPGLSVSGGVRRTDVISSDDLDANLSASGDTLTIAKSAGNGDFGTTTQPGDIVVIPVGSAFAGASDQNSGVYVVVSWSATQIVIKQLKHHTGAGEAAFDAFDATAVTAAEDSDIASYSPISVEVTASAVTGAGASLEITTVDSFGRAAGLLWRESDMADILSSASASVGRVSAVGSGDTLQITLTGASWSRTPSRGDPVFIGRSSLLSGAGTANAGQWVVSASSGTSLTLARVSGSGSVSVAQADIAGDTSLVKAGLGFASVAEAGLKMISSREAQAYLEASRPSDGTEFPTTRVGGSVALELSYNAVGATAAVVSIDQRRVMTITPTGAGQESTIQLGKFKTMAMLADFLNTIPGVSARIPDNRMRSLPTNTLDMVTSMPILGAQLTPAYNGRLKTDYYSWKKLMDDNFGLVAFSEGTMLLKAGLPDEETAAAYLEGGTIGASSNVDIQRGLDAALKIDVRMVVPLMSRDAQFDIQDSLTDADSSYDIDSINAGVRAHVATASSAKWRKERFGIVSYRGSFQDSMQKSAELGYERCQMFFQDCRAQDSDGSLQWFQPWMLACAVSAGRAQAALGTSMLNKSFGVSAVRHIGEGSLYSDSITPDFDADDQDQLSQAIEAGLATLNAVDGLGLVMVSADCSTRSRENDPEGWVYERVNVLFTCDEVRQTVRSALRPYIGKNQLQVSLSLVTGAANDAVATFVGNALVSGEVTNIRRSGVGYIANLKITPVEALEFIGLEVVAERELTDAA